MIEISLQELYNIISVIGFGFCMYKIRKMETLIDVMKSNQLVSSMINFAVTKALKDKGILEGTELDIELNKEDS